jgi:hypothetical protein
MAWRRSMQHGCDHATLKHTPVGRTCRCEARQASQLGHALSTRRAALSQRADMCDGLGGSSHVQQDCSRVEAQELDRRWRRCAHALFKARLLRERAHRSPHALPLAELARWAVERGAAPRDVLAECVLQPETAGRGPREAVVEHLLTHGLSPGAAYVRV